MDWIPGQPILFSNDTTPECCVDCWEQVVFPQDTVMFQFDVPPCFNTKPATDNCYFTSNLGWTTNNVAIGTGSALFVGIGASILQNVLNATNWYKVELEVFAIDNLVALELTGFEDTITITQEGTYEFLVKATSNQIKLETITNGGSPAGTIATVPSLCATQVSEPTIEIKDQDGVNIPGAVSTQVRSGEFVTWLFDVGLNELALEDVTKFYFSISLDCDGVIDTWTSELIREIPVDSCHLQFGFCGNIDRFNFDYFIPTLRLNALLRPGTYEYDDESYTNTDGRKTIMYASREKVYDLRTSEGPEHIMDFFSMFPLAQQVSARKRYTASKDFVTFEPEVGINYLDGSDNLARLSLTLKEQETYGNYFNGDYCGVGLPPRVLGTENPQQAILTEDNKLIEVE